MKKEKNPKWRSKDTSMFLETCTRLNMTIFFTCIYGLENMKEDRIIHIGK